MSSGTHLVDAADRSPADRSRFRSSLARTAVLASVLVAAVVGLAIDVPGIEGVRDWREGAGPDAWLVMVLAVSFALLTPTPRSVLSVAVGAAAGFSVGLAVVVLAGVLGGLGGYGISRWLGRPIVVRLAGRRLHSIDRVLEQRGFLAVLVARLLPVVPFMVVSYAAGLTRIPLTTYAVGTAVGVVPGSVLYVAAGAALSLPGSWTTPWLWGSALAAVLLTTASVMAIRRRRGRARPEWTRG